MYESHFGLHRHPFPTTPDGSWYYPASAHEHALAQLAQALQDGEGFALLTGTPGTGKTLLGQRLLEQAAPETCRVFLTHSHVSDAAGLLQSLLYDLGLPHEGKSEAELRLALTEHLLQHYTAGRPTLFILDEAQHLTPDLLEELRLLGNLEGSKGKALQVVLLAQTEFEGTLHRPGLAAFRQRLGALARLHPLGLHEAADYLIHHLRLAGGQAETFLTDEALEVLARGAGGVPRLLNRAGHTALRLAWQAGAETVDAEVALESLALCGLAVDESAADGEMGQETPDEEETATQAAVLTLDPPRPERPEERGDGRRRLFAAPKRPA